MPAAPRARLRVLPSLIAALLCTSAMAADPVDEAESGLLASRLDDLRERTLALLRAELEHHSHVRAHRRARDADSSSARGS